MAVSMIFTISSRHSRNGRVAGADPAGSAPATRPLREWREEIVKIMETATDLPGCFHVFRRRLNVEGAGQ